MADKLMKHAGYHGEIKKYIDSKTSSSSDIYTIQGLEVKHMNLMKLNPDHIEKLVSEFRDVREVYEKTYQEYKLFLNTHSTIPKKAGIFP